MADEDSTSTPEGTGGTTRKKVAKKKTTRKKAAKKKVAATSGAASAALSDDAPSPAPAAESPIPQAAVVDPGAFGGDEDTGMSGWLVMWGPLIIVGFLILVFMGSERRPVTLSAMPEIPAPAPVAAPVEPRLDISPERAAADLAEAFKAAGIPLPGEDRESAAAPAPASELPPDLQANPWAPAPGQAPAMPPPPPGYGYGQPMPPPGYGYGHPMPPPGYGYGAPPQQGYGYGAPRGYGQGYGQGYGAPQMGRPGMGMGYGAPGNPMPPQGMAPQGMPRHQMPGYSTGQPPPPPPSQ